MKKVVILLAIILTVIPLLAFAGFNLLEGEVVVTVEENPLSWVSDPSQAISVFAGARGAATWTIHNSGVVDVTVSWNVSFDQPDVVVAYAVPVGGVVPAGGDLEISVVVIVDSEVPPGTILTATLAVYHVLEES